MTTAPIIIGGLIFLVAAQYLAVCAGAERWLTFREWRRTW